MTTQQSKLSDLKGFSSSTSILLSSVYFERGRAYYCTGLRGTGEQIRAETSFL